MMRIRRCLKEIPARSSGGRSGSQVRRTVAAPFSEKTGAQVE